MELNLSIAQNVKNAKIAVNLNFVIDAINALDVIQIFVGDVNNWRVKFSDLMGIVYPNYCQTKFIELTKKELFVINAARLRD